MPEREKVIAAIQCCIVRDPDDKRRCRLCPYRDPSIHCLNRLLMDALALLDDAGEDQACEACMIDEEQEREADDA